MGRIKLKWLLLVLVALLVVRAAMTLVPWLCREEWKPPPKASAEAVKKFQEARFGLMIHWGPVSLTGREIGWSRGGVRPGAEGAGDIPVETYDSLYRQFNPRRFNAKEWVAVAKSAGMRYVVFTAKHHDGFCMYDTKLTDYKITRSPFGRDPAAELAAACREAGLLFGFYYSLPDWHNPDYGTNGRRYLQYMSGQVMELCTGYGPVHMFWFDVVTDNVWPNSKVDQAALVGRMRAKQPELVMNDRLTIGDYTTYEERVPTPSPRTPWETCMPLGKQWSYKPGDQLKTASECIRTLVSCAGGGGNFLLNVGPTPEGEIEPRQAAILGEIGQWLEKHRGSVFGVRAGAVRGGQVGRLHVRGQARVRSRSRLVEGAGDAADRIRRCGILFADGRGRGDDPGDGGRDRG